MSSPLTLSAIPIIPEQRYALRLVVFPCWCMPSMLPSFQPISPSLSSHISSIAVVPHLLRHHIHPYCPASAPPWSSTDVFTTDLVFHKYYPASPPRLHCYPPASLLRSLSHYLPSFRALLRRCLSTFYDRIFSSLCIVLYYTAWSALLHTTFLTLQSDLLTTIFFSLLEQLFSLSVMFSLRSDLPRFSSLAFTLLCSNLIITHQFYLLRSDCLISDMLNYYCSTHDLIFLLWYDLTRLLISLLFFIPLDLLISLKNNLTLIYISSSPSMYYNIEVINNLNT